MTRSFASARVTSPPATAPLPAPHGLHVGEHPGAEAEEALKEATVYLVALLAALRAIPCDAWPPRPPEAPARVPPPPTLGPAFHRAAARVGGALAHARWALG